MSTTARAASQMQREALSFLGWLLVPVLGLLLVLSVLQYRQRMDEAERAWLSRAAERAEELESLARPAADHVRDLRRLLELHWERPPAIDPGMARAMRPWPDPSVPSRVDGWTLDGASPEARQRHGQVWWGSDGQEPPADLWLRRASVAQDMARVARERLSVLEGSFFVSVERNVSWSYPWMETPRMLRAMGVGSLRELDRLRIESFEKPLREHLDHPGTNPRWGVPYVSQLNGELVQSHAAKLVVDGRLLGEVSIDLRLDELQLRAVRWRENGTRTWIVDRQGRVLADSDEPLQPPPGDGHANREIEVALEQRLPEELREPAGAATWRPWLLKSAAQDQLHAGDGVLLVASQPDSPWVYVQHAPHAVLRQAVLPSLVPNAVLGLALLVVIVTGQWLFARRFLSPSLAVLGYLRALGADPGQPEPELGARWRPWVRAVRDAVRAERAAREQLERQREALRRSERLGAMGTLLAGVAHELNNPLAIVMGRAVLLEERVLAATDAHSEAGRSVREDTRRIREAAERCGRIVRTFLAMARQQPPVRRAVQLADTVRSAADMLGYTLRSQGVQLVLDLPEDLPAVTGDPDRLGQVIVNLMVNAQQALQAVQDRERPRVLSVSAGVERLRPEAPQRDRRVWLRVADTGPGMPAELQARLFEPFFTTKASGLGTGLGLSMSATIAREHGGDLVLERSTAAGSCFRLSLPPMGGDGVAAEAPAPRTGHAPGAARAGPATEGTGDLPPRILVVDDDGEVGEVIRNLLEAAGYEVAVAESSAVALELLDEARFDGVISDLRMPDGDGQSLWQAIAARHPALARRLVFVTGDTLSADARRILEATGCPSLEKPFERDDLLRALRERLARPGPEAPPGPGPTGGAGLSGPA